MCWNDDQGVRHVHETGIAHDLYKETSVFHRCYWSTHASLGFSYWRYCRAIICNIYVNEKNYAIPEQ